MSRSPFIVTIGSGNGENILVSDIPVEVGHKHSVTMREMYGGSGVNHSFRLASMGKNILPILTIGNDRIGSGMQQVLGEVAQHNHVSPLVSDYIRSDNFFDENITTPTSTVIVDGTVRTIFSQKVQCVEHYDSHISKRLEKIETLIGDVPGAIMIGHIHSDNSDCLFGEDGGSTKYLVNRYKKKCLIYSNFGNSQIQLGLDFWKNELGDIDVFQLNIAEARKFFLGEDETEPGLPKLVDIIRKMKITAVITIDRFGAIGLHRDKPDKLIFAWSLIGVNDIVDTTGAGDAFAAGMVSRLLDAGENDFTAFHQAMEVARNWSAYACTRLGGSADCPNQDELSRFVARYSSNTKSIVESVPREEAEKYLKLIDTDYQH